MKNKIYNVGLYIRLSREDGDNLESESIINQREILKSFLNKNKESIIFIDEYVDDGYSGSNFDRPSWKRLLFDIENKKINTIITKDLSRMGRDYISMGEYIERIFPENNIRYIALNDDIDTLYETPGLDILQFKLVFNDYYLKDTSKKIRKVLKSKKEKGQFLGWKAVYGYIKDPNDKYKLIIDYNVKDNVKRIFDLAFEGKSSRQIANILSEEKIPNPSIYANLNRAGKSSSYELWCSRTIDEMLTNETYIGNLTQGRRKKINYKSNKEIRTSKDDWIIVENTHEGIIDKDKFNTIQSLIKKNKNKQISSNDYLLSGFLYCKECGHKISINNSSDGKRKYTVCSYYTANSRFKLCTPHSNNYNKLETIVLNEIRNIIKLCADANKIIESVNKELKNKDIFYINKKDIEMTNNKIQNNLIYIDKIYEDKLSNQIDIEMYNRLTSKYKAELEKLKNSKIKLENEMVCYKNNAKEITLNKVKEYLEFTNPNRNELVNLIDKIYIAQDKTLEIHYKFMTKKN